MKIVVRVPNWIGDAVLSLPAIGALKADPSVSKVWVAAVGWVKDLFSFGTPADGVVALPGGGSPAALREAARALNRGGFDAGLLLTNSFGSAAALALARVPERWGYRRDGRGFLLTRRVKLDDCGAPVHQAEYYLRLVRELGFEGPPAPIRLRVTPAEKKAARGLLDSAGARDGKKRPLVVLNPGASYGPAKRWPVDRFAQLASRLQDERSAEVVIVGAPAEAGLAEQMASRMPRRPMVLSGKTDLRGLLGLLSWAKLFVTNDSGPMHMANALAVPVIGIFGPTVPAATRPYQPPSTVIWRGAPCWPCLYRTCPYGHQCLTSVEVAEVLAAALAYLR